MNAIIAIIPIVLLFVLMLGIKMAGHKSALITLLVTIALALFVAPAYGFRTIKLYYYRCRLGCYRRCAESSIPNSDYNINGNF